MSGARRGWTVGVGRIGSIVGPLLGGALIAAHLGADRLFLIAGGPGPGRRRSALGRGEASTVRRGSAGAALGDRSRK